MYTLIQPKKKNTNYCLYVSIELLSFFGILSLYVIKDRSHHFSFSFKIDFFFVDLQLTLPYDVSSSQFDNTLWSIWCQINIKFKCTMYRREKKKDDENLRLKKYAICCVQREWKINFKCALGLLSMCAGHFFFIIFMFILFDWMYVSSERDRQYNDARLKTSFWRMLNFFLLLSSSSLLPIVIANE